MNERIIRKLLAEALDNDTVIASRTFGHWPLYDEDLEKFAELIVQECIDIIAPYTVRMSKPGEEYLHPILEIKEHFGVEE